MILNNPFHVLGLVANCGQKDFNSRLSRVSAYLSVGKPLVFADDIYFQGCTRNSSSVELAKRELETGDERIKHALFWFTDGGILDGKALEYIRNNDLAAAEAMLSKAKDRPEVTQNYVSSLSNYGTLKMLQGVMERSPEQVKEGISSKAILLGKTEESVLKEYFTQVADSVSGSNLDAIIINFSEALEAAINDWNKRGIHLNSSDVARALDVGGQRFEAVKSKFAIGARTQLEAAISKSQTKRKANVSQALSGAEVLIKDATEHLIELKAMTGADDLQYQTLADKVALEILQSTIEYFNNQDGSSSADLDKILKLVRFAERTAKGVKAQERIAQNKETLEEIREQAVEREALGPKAALVDRWIGRMMEPPSTSDAAISLVEQGVRESCGALLSFSHSQRNELFDSMCDTVANVALNVLIEVVNRDLKKYSAQGVSCVGSLKRVSRVIDKLKWLPLSKKTQTRLSENAQTISESIRVMRYPFLSGDGLLLLIKISVYLIPFLLMLIFGSDC